jgi:hypothetical protein
MTRLELIQIIGDVISQIDVARGSLLPDDPNRHRLDDLRVLLDDRQRKLSQSTFDDSTPEFQQAAAKLKTVDTEIRGSIQQVNNIAAVLGNINKFLGAATSLITTIGPFV